MDIQILHDLFLQCSSVSIDTRKIEKEAMFFAIKGENYDANTFAKEALEKGASFVVIDNKNYFIDHRTILVQNSVETLQELAKFHREYLGIPIIALTGSNGKTTTKELIHVVLSKKYSTSATKGNLNNHLGVPLTILSFDASTEIGIVEMGANHQKEIEFLCQIAQPDYGYITNFGKAHLEGFGGIEGVVKGKSEMYDYLFLNNKIVFVNLDDDIQKMKTSKINHFSFGLKNKDVDILIDEVEANPLVNIKYNDIIIRSNLIGLYNANNINAAITIGKYFGVSDLEIKSAIESYVPVNNRSQLIKNNGLEIILDAYNANPSSMKEALKNFIQLEKPNKVLIIGDMFELGTESINEHKLIVDSLLDHKNIQCNFVGKDFFKVKRAVSHFNFFENFETLSEYLESIKIHDGTVLIKGSRGMALERILDFI